MAANRSLTALPRTLAPDGTLVLGGGGGGRWLASIPILKAKAVSPLVSQRLSWIDEAPSRQNLGLLSGWIESGLITPAIDRAFPLSETPDAMRYLLREHARAKVVVVA